MMFIAIENADSAYGYKSKNTDNKPSINRSKTEQKRHEKGKQEIPSRQLLAEATGDRKRG
jgi:hypothetical protein